MTVNTASLVNSLGAGLQLLTAAVFIFMIVPLIVFFGLQRYFVSGLLAGSVKGYSLSGDVCRAQARRPLPRAAREARESVPTTAATP